MVKEIFSRIGCLILSSILFFVIIMFLIFELIPKIITKDNIKHLEKETSIVDSFIEKENKELLDNLYIVFKTNNLDSDIVDNIVNSREFKKIKSNYIGDIFDNIVNGSGSSKLESKEIIEIFDKELDLLEITLSNEEKNVIIGQIEEIVKNYVDLVPTSNSLINEIGTDNLNAIRMIYNNSFRGIFIIVIIIIVLLMALFRWSIFRFAIWSGIPTIIAGGIFVLMATAFSDMVLNIDVGHVSLELKEFLINNIFVVIKELGMKVLILGIAQVIYYYLMKKSINDSII